jgi:hypothetical protein
MLLLGLGGGLYSPQRLPEALIAVYLWDKYGIGAKLAERMCAVPIGLVISLSPITAFPVLPTNEKAARNDSNSEDDERAQCAAHCFRDGKTLYVSNLSFFLPTLGRFDRNPEQTSKFVI